MIGEKELYKAIFGEFIEDIERKYPHLVIAYKQEDFTALGRLVHYIKGEALNLGADLLGMFAKKLEIKAKAKNMDHVEELLERIEIVIPRLKEFMLTKMF